MIMMNGHAGAEHGALFEAKAATELDIAVRGQDLVEPARIQQRLAPVSAVTAVDIGSTDNVARRQGVDIPGSERLVVVHGVAQLRVQVDRVSADDLAAERHTSGIRTAHAQQIGQPGRRRDAIIVQEGQHLATSRGDAGISGAGDTCMLVQRQNPDMNVRWIHPVVYLATVEDEQQLEGGLWEEEELTRDSLYQELAATLTPSRRHDDADVDVVR